jgi:hypothetical protein
MNKFKLKLTPRQLAVIWAFLSETRLGTRNEYEDEISDLCIKLQDKGIEDYLNDELDGESPKINVEFNQDDGLVFNIAE